MTSTDQPDAGEVTAPPRREWHPPEIVALPATETENGPQSANDSTFSS